MKQGRTLTQLAAELERQRESAKDFVADTRQILYTPDRDALVLAGKGTFPVGAIAHRQIADRLSIPNKYYDRMRQDAPQLLAANINHWLANTQERRMIRTLDGSARAFLSDRYRPLDNFALAESVLPRLQQANAVVVSCEVTEAKMYLKAIVPGIEEQIAPKGVDVIEWGKGHHQVDIVQPGIVISNSEVGYGALAIQPAIHTVKCTNLATFRSDAMRKYHVGRRNGGEDSDGAEQFFSDRTRTLSDAALWSQVADLVTAALTGDVFKNLVTKLKTARGQTIEGDPMKAVEEVAKRFTLNKDEQGSVLRHLIEGGDLSAYGMHAAVTRSAQDIGSYDRASELEAAGAEIIELKRTDWQQIAQAA